MWEALLPVEDRYFCLPMAIGAPLSAAQSIEVAAASDSWAISPPDNVLLNLEYLHEPSEVRLAHIVDRRLDVHEQGTRHPCMREV